jgi:hypothetical protein
MTEQEKIERRRQVRTAVVDRTLHKVVSRKLLVWTSATIALFLGSIDSSNWVDICMVYIGTEAAVNAVVALRKG